MGAELEKKMGVQANRAELKALVAALECMPLVLTQTAAYIKRRGDRSSIQQYLEKVQKGDQSTFSLLDFDETDLRRGRRAKNSMSLT